MHPHGLPPAWRVRRVHVRHRLSRRDLPAFEDTKKPACRGLSLFSSLFYVAAIRGKSPRPINCGAHGNCHIQCCQLFEFDAVLSSSALHRTAPTHLAKRLQDLPTALAAQVCNRQTAPPRTTAMLRRRRLSDPWVLSRTRDSRGIVIVPARQQRR